jgi:hypothetical protein
MLDVPFETEMVMPHLKPHDGAIDGIWITSENTSRPLSLDSVGRWLKELSFRDRMLFMAAGHDTLLSLGYERDVEWSFRDMTISREDAMLEIELVNEELTLLQSGETLMSTEVQSSAESDSSLRLEKVIIDEPAVEIKDAQLPSSPTSPLPSSLPTRR